MSCHSVTCVKAAAGKALDGCDGNAGKRSQHIIISAATEFHKKKEQERTAPNPPPPKLLFHVSHVFSVLLPEREPDFCRLCEHVCKGGLGREGWVLGSGVGVGSLSRCSVSLSSPALCFSSSTRCTHAHIG